MKPSQQIAVTKMQPLNYRHRVLQANIATIYIIHINRTLSLRFSKVLRNTNTPRNTTKQTSKQNDHRENFARTNFVFFCTCTFLTNCSILMSIRVLSMRFMIMVMNKWRITLIIVHLTSNCWSRLQIKKSYYMKIKGWVEMYRPSVGNNGRNSCFGQNRF